MDDVKSPAAPSGAVIRTLLLSDLVGSTRLVEELGDEASFQLFGRHDRLARDLLRQCNGREIDKTDGFLLLFERPGDAVAYATAYHRALVELSQELEIEISSRIGIHLGEVYLRENPPEDVALGAKPLEVEGLAKPVAARLMSLAGGGQTLLTQGAFDVARRSARIDPELCWLAHGDYRFKGVDEPVAVFEVGVEGLSPLAAPAGSEKVQRLVEDETVLGWRPAPTQPIPKRESWRLERRLGAGGFGEVWLARHHKTGDERVFKFCFDAERLRGLQREVTLFRLLKDTLGARDDIARIIDWDFAHAPYFVEAEYTAGGSLGQWAEEVGGITEVALETRLELVAETAEALAAAHSVGILHKDLKPANILIWTDRDGSPRARLTDFGIGLVTDTQRLEEAGITVLGMTETFSADGTPLSGTPLFMAPEVLEGKPATVQADVYALGILLYQLVVGDLRRALAPGWERDVADELLRADISACVDGSPTHRLADAAELARRLRSLQERHRQQQLREQEQRAAAQAARRRRRTAVAAVVLAVMALVAWLQVWRVLAARQREQLARRLGSEVQLMESLMRFAHLAPLHDLTADRQRVRQRLEVISELLQEAGSGAHGPGSYALGRGHLALGEYEAARHHLEAAWEEGYREPGVADALGLTLGNLYRQQLDRLRLISEPAVRAAAQQRIEQELRDPAITYLQASSGVGLVVPEYVEGLLALFEQRYDDALALAERCSGAAEWFYEGRLLEAEVRLNQATELRDRGEGEAALAAYQQADTAFCSATTIGESDPRGYDGLCRLWMQVMELHLYSIGGELEPAMQRAIAACDQAVVADPQRVEVLTTKSDCYRMMAELDIRHQRDPGEAIAGARAAAKQAVDIDPQFAAGHHKYGNSFTMAVWYASSRNQEASDEAAADADAAVAALERAAALDNSDAFIQLDLGNAYNLRASAALARGDDPRGEYERSAAAFSRATELSPTYSSAFNNLASVEINRAEYEIESDRDPLPYLKRAVVIGEQALQIKPDHLYAVYNVGSAYLLMGQHELKADRDPTSALEKASESFARALEINPDYPPTFVNLADIDRTVAQYQLRQGLPATTVQATLSHGLEIVEQVLAMIPDWPPAREVQDALRELAASLAR